MENVTTIIFEALIGILVLVVVRYLVPWLQVAKRKNYADHIFRIADQVTDDLKEKYPNNGWLGFLDTAVDKVMAICHVDKEIAKRAVNAQVTRKKNGAIKAAA